MATASTPQNDLIIGNSSNEKLFGAAGNDIILGNGGNDQLTGGGGNDDLVGGDGEDILNGSNATLRGAKETDYAFGGGGRDTYILGDEKGSYYVAAGWGDHLYIDGFEVGKDKVQLHGQASDYFTSTFGGSTWLFTKAGNDPIASFAGLKSLNLTSADFVYKAPGGEPVNVINGTPGQDELRGTDGRDIIRGRDGGDQLFGLGGNDTLDGGNGNDVVFGGQGNDTIIISGDGFDNRDSLNGDEGNDTFVNRNVPLGSAIIEGGSGTDTVTYNQAADLDGIVVTQALNFDRFRVSSSIRGVKNGALVGDTDQVTDVERFVAPKGSTQSKFILTDLGIASTRFIPGPPNLEVTLANGALTQTGGYIETASNTRDLDSLQLRLFNFSHVSGTFKADRITGNAEDNILNGGGGQDILNGRGGNDILIGGRETGGGTFTGGAGRDRFYIPTPITVGTRGPGGAITPYEITDFRSNEQILVGQNGFRPGALENDGLIELGAITEAQFGLGRDFTTPEQRFAYDRATGELFYDSNGSAPAIPSPALIGVSIKIATLQGSPLLKASNIIVANDDLLQAAAVTVPEF